MRRTHTCGELTIKNVGANVVLQGWIAKIRKMGALAFIDIRDRYGITQLVVGEKFSKELSEIKNEFVIEVIGKVIERKSKNLELITGAIEIEVEKIIIINKAELTPFEIKDKIESQEETRLTYRYLDLRRPEMQNNLIIRSKMNTAIRNFFVQQNFLEIETPIFGKSTPEGARDFLVPSRLNVGKFYALPQSPQLYKQLFMVSGLDRYFQIVKCFRDEDLRIDRQPEFTQLDMEMSFADSEDVMNMIENMLKNLVNEVKGIKIQGDFQRMTWAESFDKFGNDKPDLRFGCEIKTLDKIFAKTSVPLFENLIQTKKTVRGICVESLLTKKEIELLTETAKQNSVDILAFVKYANKEWTGPLAAKLSETEKNELLAQFKIKKEATFLMIVEEYARASQAMGAVRSQVGKMLNLINENELKFIWIVDFPLFEFSEEENRFVAAHHPFTMPSDNCVSDFDKNRAKATAKAYDIVLNGFEIGGGSQRITDPQLQERMFKAIELSPEQVEQNFGWFVNAYKYGAPYHAGCALGLDRICMLLTNSQNIREVIAFPKNSSGIDPMTNAPDKVALNQLDELHIKLK